MISNFTSKLTQELTLYVDGLQEEFPKQSYSLELNGSSNIWEIKWKSSKHYKESFEIEIWSENNQYTLRGEHIIDELLSQVTETYFLYEEISIAELLLKFDEIFKKMESTIKKISHIDKAKFL